MPKEKHGDTIEVGVELETHFNNESNIGFHIDGNNSVERPSISINQSANRNDETSYQIRQLLNEESSIQDMVTNRINQLKVETMNSVYSSAGRSSIDMENLFKMKEEYIFLFGKDFKLKI